MKKFRQIFAILFNSQQPVIFGLQHALNIFRQTKGRYDGDESKAVPFAILATATALGAEVKIQEEGMEAIENINEIINEKLSSNANFEKRMQAVIADMLKDVEEKKISIEEAASRTQKAVEDFTRNKNEVEAALEFFTV